MRRTATVCLLIGVLATAAVAKGVRATTLDEACAQAPIVVLAQVTRGQYQSLKDGESVDVDVYALWQEFKVLRTLAQSKSLVKPGETLRIVDKNNSCIRFTTQVTRDGDSIVTESKKEGRKTTTLAALKKVNSGKVLLFLTPRKPDAGIKFDHFGWSVSPQKWTKDLEEKVVSNLAKR